MNTTFDSKMKCRTLTSIMGDEVRRWKMAQPSLSVIASSIKSWKHDLGTLCLDDQYQVTTTRNADLALDEAWQHRDNAAHAIKAAEEAWQELSRTEEALNSQEAFVPLHERRNRAMLMNMHSVKSLDVVDMPDPEEVVVSKRIKSWMETARAKLDEIHYASQKNRRYISQNPQLEGRIYAQNAVRAKAWFDENRNVRNVISAKSAGEIDNIQAQLDRVMQIGGAGWIDDTGRRGIHQALRLATKSLNNVQPVTRTPQVKANLFLDVEKMRKGLDNMMPLVQSGSYDDSDLFREVTQTIDQVKALSRIIPVKMLPPDTMENLENTHHSLAQMIQSKNHHVRVKSLRAAAANLDVLANDLAAMERNQKPVWE